MSGEQLEEAGVDRLAAAVFEQRRLSHMLRQRGTEIEALQADRERLAGREREARERERALRRELRELEDKATSLRAEVASLSEERKRQAEELKQAQYEVRRAERRVANAREESMEALAGAERDAAKERKRAGHRLDEIRVQLASLTANRDSIVTELKQAEYEARRAERRLAKTTHEAAEARKRDRLQLDAMRTELEEGLGSRNEALKRERRALAEREEARVSAAEMAQEAAADAREVEASALELGRAQREVELLAGQEKDREILLADSEQTLTEVADHLRRVRASRSWRWGHAIAQALRTLTFRRRSSRSALDNALERLGVGADRGAPSSERQPS